MKLPSPCGRRRGRGGRVNNLALALMTASLTTLAACGKTNQYQPPPPPSVTVSKPLSMPVTDYLQATGSVAPSKSVDLVARVEGYLQSVDFQDGSLVRQGQPLFLIEPDQYQAKLQSNQAALQNAQSEYERQLRLIKENATSQANVEKWQSQRDQAKAAVDLAKINLGYTRITAPFSGRIGRHLVDPGNLVGGMQATKLATLDQIDPVFVYFNVNERDVLRVRNAAMERGEKLGGSIEKLPIYVGLQTESDFPHEGTLDFADNGLNTSSGTIQVRAVLPNKSRVLLPGMFARLRIPLGPPKPALMVPDRVVGNDQAEAT